jgi:hypothetical protein
MSIRWIRESEVPGNEKLSQLPCLEGRGMDYPARSMNNTARADTRNSYLPRLIFFIP